MPRSPKIEQEYRSFLARFDLPAFRRETADQVFAEARRGGRESIETFAPGVSAEVLTKMMQDSGRGMQFVIDHLSKEIERNIDKSGLKLDLEYFAGEFPTGSFNAQACPVKDGALFLLNTGLMMFIHKAAKLVMHATHFAPFGDDGKPISDGSDPIEAGGLTHGEMVEAFAELILGYLSTQANWVSRVRRLPVETGAKMMLSAMVVNSCEKFALAHEYGHAIAGHLTAPQTLVSKTPVGEVELVSKKWSDEFEADLIAAMLLISEAPRQIRNTDDLFTLQLATVGPFFFFALDQLITRVVLEIKGLPSTSIVTDHPPSHQRVQAVRELYLQIGGPRAIEMGNAFAEVLDHIGDSVIKTVGEKVVRNSQS